MKRQLFLLLFSGISLHAMEIASNGMRNPSEYIESNFIHPDTGDLVIPGNYGQKVDLQRLPIYCFTLCDGGKFLEACIRAGGNVNSYDPGNGLSVLFQLMSCISAYTPERGQELVDLLLEKGVDLVHTTPNTKQTIMHKLALWEIEGYVEKFVKHGADINAQDSQGRTPLHYAIDRYGISWYGSHANMNVAKELVNCGAAINKINCSGCTPLYGIVNIKDKYKTMCKDIMAFMIVKGANLEHKDKFGFTLRDHLRMYNKNDLYDVLKDKESITKLIEESGYSQKQ